MASKDVATRRQMNGSAVGDHQRRPMADERRSQEQYETTFTDHQRYDTMIAERQRLADEADAMTDAVRVNHV